MRLGAWELTRRSAGGASTWTKTQDWPAGSLVRHRKKTYVALGRCNSAEPGSRLPYVFWHLFRDPAQALSVVVIVQVRFPPLPPFPPLFPVDEDTV